MLEIIQLSLAILSVKYQKYISLESRRNLAVMEPKEKIFENQSVVITGKLASLPRKEAQQLIRRLGGKTPSSLTKTTNYLVVGDGGYLINISKSNKLKHAESFNEQGSNIEIISESTFLELVGLDSAYKLENKYYPLSDIIKLYPTLRRDRIRYFQKWGLLKPVVKTNIEQYFEFKDLLIFRRIDTYLKQGKSIRGIAQGLRNKMFPIKQLAINFEDEAPEGRVLEFKKPAMPEKSAEEWYDIGYKYDSHPETYDKAIEAYENALKIDSNFVPAAINLGNVYYEKGQKEKARDLYLHALKLQPTDHKILFNLGNLYDDLGDLSAALNYFKEAIQQHPLYGDAHFNIAVVYEKMAMKEEAKKHWQLYLKVDNSGEWAEIAHEHLMDS